MKNETDNESREVKSLEEEREYWEARGPLAEGHRGRLNKPSPDVQRCSFLSLRMSGAELTRLRDLAMQFDCGPSTFARRVLVAVMDQMEKRAKVDQGKADRSVTLEEICQSVEERMPGPVKERLANLVKSIMIGNPPFVLVDPSQVKEYLELGQRIMAAAIETANPNIKVKTPFDTESHKVNSAVDIEKGKDNPVSRLKA